MTLDEYIETATQELKKFKEEWELGHKKTPEHYPMELEVGDWGEQELAMRFQ